MQIISLNISANKTSLEFTINDASDVSTLRFWNDSTYKNYNKAIDLSAKLNNTATQNIIVSLADIKEPYFDGVYFIEARDSDEVSVAMTAELSRFKECIMDKLLAMDECDECLRDENESLKNAHVALRSLEDAIFELRLPEEAVATKKLLDKFCSNSCRSCGDYSNIVTSASKDTLAPDTIIVTLDGGSLD